MPNRKFTSRFPPARLKKIMRTDKEVGKVAASVPIVLSRSLELFAEGLIAQAGQITTARGSRTLSPAHLRQCIMTVKRFDFLRELVADIADVSACDENGMITHREADEHTPDFIPTMSARSCNGTDVATSSAVASSTSTESSLAAVKSTSNGQPAARSFPPTFDGAAASQPVSISCPGFYQPLPLLSPERSDSPAPAQSIVQTAPLPDAYSNRDLRR